MKFLLLILVSSIIVSCSCSKEEMKYTQLEIIELGKILEPNLSEVQFDLNNTSDPNRVVCKNYGVGCVPTTGKRIKVRRVELIVIQFESEKAAMEEAMRLNQWYARDWLFDNVTHEPVLIDFVKKAYGAKPGFPDKQ